MGRNTPKERFPRMSRRRSPSLLLALLALLATAPAALAGPVGAPGSRECLHSGDVNADAVVSAGDAQLAFLIALGSISPSPTEACAADCNGDGLVSAGDAQAIFLAALGAGRCPLALPDGADCTVPDDCLSDHCQNGFCCAAGDCCAAAADCPETYAAAALCDEPATCQGTRSDAVCNAASNCESLTVDDDSACDSALVVSECGLYPTVTCSGAADQTPPACATTCAAAADCDAGAVCEDTGAPDGRLCVQPVVPTVWGEWSAGHAQPWWLWQAVPDVAATRFRIDGGAWAFAPAGATQIESPEPLAEGPHTFELQFQFSDGSYSQLGAFTTLIETYPQPGYWDGVARTLATSPQDHRAAVACHNCYDANLGSPAANLAGTLARLHAAQAAGADLLELDLKVQAGAWRVDHDDDGDAQGALLSDVLADPDLLAGDQLLLIEIKETAPTEGDLRALLQALADAGYATNGRPVLLRAFRSLEANLTGLGAILAAQEFPLHEHYIRLHVLFGATEASGPAAFQGLVLAASNAGYHATEFNFQTPSLWSPLNYARSLGLGTLVWTIPTAFGEVYCATLRNDVDGLITDYPVGSCRAVVEDQTSLLYLHPFDADPEAATVPYYTTDATAYDIAVNAAGAPDLWSDEPGEDRYGTSLWFHPELAEKLSFYDADNDPDAGYLVAIVANFDDLALEPDETMAFFNKSDSASFAFELFRPAAGDAVLRFGVFVDGGYRYATYPATNLNDTDSYLLVGAYDGNGSVRLFVNNAEVGTPAGPYLAGVAQNDSPVTLGADPQGPVDTRFHFNGKIQMAMLQTWADHPSDHQTLVPTVWGEASAGHAEPWWQWLPEADVTATNYRVDGGPWLTAPAGATQVQSPEPLAAGPHTFELQFRFSDGLSSEIGFFTTVVEYYVQPGYWNGVARTLATSPQDHRAAVACHNCYDANLGSPAANLTGTLDRLHAAQASGADLLELDIKVQAGAWRVDHDDDGDAQGALLADVLVDAALGAGDQLLLIEIKETAPTEGDLRTLLQTLTDAGYARNGRPVMLRAFRGIQTNLTGLRDILALHEFPLHEHYVRLHVLFGATEAGDPAAFQNLVLAASTAGFDATEFNYQTPNLWSPLTYARALGLGTLVWTVPVTYGEVYCAVFRNDVDGIITDYPVASCRTVVEDATSLLYIHPWDTDAGATSVPYYTTDATPQSIAVNAAGAPALLFDPPGEDRYGTSFWFHPELSEKLSFYDADNTATGGYFAALVVNFDDLDLIEGETMALLNKADAGSFSFELYRPVGGATVLRFGVHVSGAYQYATYAASNFNDTDSYLLIGAYDGNGSVRLWVNNAEVGTPAGPFTAGVTQNQSPVTLGADPQGAVDTRFYFNGKIQMAMLQTWADH